MNKAVVLSLCVLAVGFIGISSALAQEEAREAEGQQFRAREIRMDRNFDGVVDRVEIYDEKGVIIRLEVDTNGDGKMNEWIFYKDGNPTKGERDANGDGKVDTWLRYNKEGMIIKSEADTDGNGKIDEWVIFKDGRPTQAERDTNGDGKADTWIIY